MNLVSYVRGCVYDDLLLDPDSYEVSMARKRGVYQWLQRTNSDATNSDSDPVSSLYLRDLYMHVCISHVLVKLKYSINVNHSPCVGELLEDTV